MLNAFVKELRKTGKNSQRRPQKKKTVSKEHIEKLFDSGAKQHLSGVPCGRRCGSVVGASDLGPEGLQFEPWPVRLRCVLRQNI